MSTAEILSLVSLISYILAGICLVLAVFFWFFFKIPSVIGDLSGRTARRSIEKMRQANMRSGNKSYRTSATNAARGKITDTMPQTAQPQRSEAPPQRPFVPETGRPETGLLTENKADAYVDVTTEVLDREATGMLADTESTVALNTPAAPQRRAGGKRLVMIHEIMLINTDEVI